MFLNRNIPSASKSFDRIAGARLLLIIMKLFGIVKWNDSKDYSRSFQILQSLYRYILHLPFSILFCILMWVEAFRATDLGEAGNVVYMSICLCVYIVKLLSVWVLYAKFKDFFHDLEFNPVFKLRTQTEEDMWMREQRKFYIVVAVFVFGSVSSVVFTFFAAITADDYQLGYDYYVPFDWRNPRNYWYAQAFDIIGMFICCASNVSLDMLGCYEIFHVGLLYKLLSLKLHELREAGEKEVMEKLLNCIKLQRNIKRITKDCETLVSPCIVSQLIFSALIICFSGYRIQKMSILENLGQFFAMVQFTSVMILEVFLPCYYASELTVNSEILLHNIFELSWFEFSVPTRKFIFLYMEFLKAPVKMKAGNYFDIGLPIFAKVMQNSYSFLALLLNVEI